MVKIVLVVLIVGAGVLLYLWRAAGTISGAQAQQLVGDGATLVDVRSPAEFADGHIDGAVNIPVDSVEARSGELGEPSQPIVVYCRSGARSARAKSILEGKGFTQVSDLGGMYRWP